MRKLLFALTCIAATVFAASCNKSIDSGKVVSGEEITATFEVNSPDVAVTKAISDGSKATALTVAVYDEDGKYLPDLSDNANANKSGAAPTWTVKVKLIAGFNYQFVFFAKSAADNGFSTFTPADGNLAIDYTKLTANNDNADFFYAKENVAATGSLSKSVEMFRPLAQVNFGSGDLTDAAYLIHTEATGDDAMKTEVKLTGIYSGMNLLTGAVSGSASEITFGEAVRVAEDQAFVTGYDRIAMVYALVDKENQGLSQATLSVSAKSKATGATGTLDIERVIENVPLKRNYRTNILGNLFTGDAVFTVNTVPGFDNVAYGDEHVADYVPTFTTIDDINAKLASGVYALALDVPSATAIDGTIILPDTDADIYLYILNDHSAAGNVLNIQYADGAANHPKNLYFYAKKLNTLNGDLPETHVEINSYSYIQTGVMATSGTTLVIQPFAYYGNLKILKGGLKVEGKVAKASLEPTDPTEVINVTIVKDAEKEINGQVIILNVTEGNTSVTTENSEGGEPTVAPGTSEDDKPAVVEMNVSGGTATVEDGTNVTTLKQEDEGQVIVQNPGDVTNPIEADDDTKVTQYIVANVTTSHYYLSLEEAIAEVEDGETLKLLVDLTQDDGVNFNKEGVSAKFNLNNKTFKVNNGASYNNRAIRIDNGTLEVYDGTIVAVGAGTTSSDGTGCYGAFRVESNGKLIAHDLTLSNARPWGLNVKVLGGEAELTDVIINSSYGGGIEVTEANLGSHSKTGKATLTNCTFTQTGYYDHCSSTLSVSGGSDLIINSGSYTSDNHALYVFSSGGHITVNGGTFVGGTEHPAIVAMIDVSSYPEYTGGLKLKAGEYTGAFSITSPAYMEVTGGTFDHDPTAYVAFGYEANQIGTKWTVVKSTDWAYNIASDEEFAAATSGNTVSISTPQLLAKLAANVNAGDDFGGKVIELTSDIDLQGYEWEPIGNKAHNFAGEFNGNNHTVSNLKVTRGTKDIDLNWRLGFIGSAINAKVHDFTVHNAYVVGRGELGAAVGYNAYGDNSTAYIDKVKVTGHVYLSAAYRGAGGICGYSNRPITNCRVDVDATSLIDGFWASGGIVGFSPQSGNIKNNYSNLKVVSDYACGGIVGLIEDSVEISGNTVENTSLKGSSNYGTGGIIGLMNYGTGLLIQNNIVNNVVIESTENVAGILGTESADSGKGNVQIKNNTLTDVTIKSKAASSDKGTALFIGYIKSDKTATIEGNSFSGTVQSDVVLENGAIWSGVTASENVTVSNNTLNYTQIPE